MMIIGLKAGDKFSTFSCKKAKTETAFNFLSYNSIFVWIGHVSYGFSPTEYVWWIMGKLFCVFTAKLSANYCPWRRQVYSKYIQIWIYRKLIFIKTRHCKTCKKKKKKKKAPAIPQWHYRDYAGFLRTENTKQFQAIKQIWQPCGPSDTPGVTVLTLLAEPSANPASPLSASPHTALQLLAQEGPLQLPAHKRQSQSARICKSLR